MWLGIGVELLLIVALVYLPWLQWVFGTAPFPAATWLLLLACTPALLIGDELRKAVLRARERGRTGLTR